MKIHKTLTLVAISLLLAGCATTPRDADIRTAAVQIFGSDANLKIHEVIYAGPISSALSGMGTSDELALSSDMQPGAQQNLDLVVWSYSSSKAASVLLRALRYPGVQQLPHLRLLFVGDAQDADQVRLSVEATGAKFYFHQR
jgi:type IV pilus biogenesis protein CpaD/CtpE